MAYDYTIKGNPLASGYQTGQMIGGGLRSAFKDRPAMKQALARIAQGEDANQVVRELAAQNPNAASMLMQQMQAQYETQAAPIQLERQQMENQALRSGLERQQRWDQGVGELESGGRSPKTLKMLTLINPERTSALLSSLSQIDANSMQYIATNLAGAAGMTNFDAQTKLLNDLSKESSSVSPALSQQLSELAQTQDPQQRMMGLSLAIRTIGEGGYLGGGKKIKSTYKTDGGVRLVYEDGSTAFVSASEKEIEAANAAAEREADAAALKRRKELEVERDVKPSLAYETTKQQQTAQEEVKAGKDNKEAARQLEQFNIALDNLEQSLTETTTGPIVGRVPAMSSEAQTAEGARAVLAPILKQLTRVAGEGVFTDKDQELLMQQLPSRTDTPEAVKRKIEMVRQAMNAKLKRPDASMSELLNGGGSGADSEDPAERAAYWRSKARGG